VNAPIAKEAFDVVVNGVVPPLPTPLNVNKFEVSALLPGVPKSKDATLPVPGESSLLLIV
jgi:hypothetical protein